MWVRLRQIAVMVDRLEPVVDDLRSVFGIEVAFRDPSVGEWDLANAVLPVGDQFLEILEPLKEGTAGGRQLARRGGDGGYMVILQSEDHGPLKERLEGLGVRKAIDRDEADYHLLQLHPKDTGGSFLEVDVQVGGSVEPGGPWHPAGDDWQRAARTDVVTGIAAAEVQGPEPGALAARWGEVLDLEVTDDGGRPTLRLNGASIRFVPDDDGRGEGLGGIDVVASDPERALAAAKERGLADDAGVIIIGGLRMNLVEAG